MEHEESITIKKHTLWQFGTFVFAALLIVSLFTGGFGLGENRNDNPTVTGNAVAGNNVPAPEPSKAQINIEGAPMLGKKDAPVTLVEFSDYQCPFCRKFWQDTLPSIKKDYIDTGKVKFVYKDFPLGFHPGAIPYAEAARCAKEKVEDIAYWKMHDKIFEEQNKLDGGTVSSTVTYAGDATLKQWAKDIGYDISSCLDSGKYKSAVQKDLSEGSAAGVQGTPGFFVNGKIISGAQPYQVFKQAIDAELNA
ncbi:MAG: DsbA family protein [Nanoarchaeota archaeon]